eukprot:2698288-Prymnesium_polylepis.2
MPASAASAAVAAVATSATRAATEPAPVTAAATNSTQSAAGTLSLARHVQQPPRRSELVDAEDVGH